MTSPSASMSPSGTPSPNPSPLIPTTQLYDLNKFKNVYNDPQEYRDVCVTQCTNAERCERYDDMSRFIKEVIRASASCPNKELAENEKNMLYIAYKNIFYQLRMAWKTIVRMRTPPAPTASMLAEPPQEKYYDLLEDYQMHLEREIQLTANDIITLLDQVAIKNTQRVDAKVFYLKLCGDYYRYWSEVIHTKDRPAYEKRCLDTYATALKLAHSALPPTHPIRNIYHIAQSDFRVALYECARERRGACEIAKNAFDNAITKLDDLDEVSYKDATLIMQLLRDNLTLWTQAEQQHHHR